MQSMDLATLDRHLALLWSRPGQRYVAFPGMPEAAIGYEERTRRDRYDWDGRRRGGPASVVAQYTLAGWGAYNDHAGRIHRVGPGVLFLAVIPGDHRYYLPPESPNWRFLYVHIHHAATIQRLAGNCAEGHAVLPADPDHPCIGALVRMWTSIRRGEVRDDLALEHLLSDIALSHARLVRDRRPDQAERQELIDAMRARHARDPARPLPVEDLARSAGMSRTAWAHRFARLVGLPPARFIIELRLEEVRRQLLAEDATLAEIAQRTGFADANHLCKVFRRHVQRSPGMWRAEMRGARGPRPGTPETA
jgi:AraC-like DNA-binding protein